MGYSSINSTTITRNNTTICCMEKFDYSSASVFYESVLSGDIAPFCDSCMEKISYYISNINITGNQGDN